VMLVLVLCGISAIHMVVMGQGEAFLNLFWSFYFISSQPISFSSFLQI